MKAIRKTDILVKMAKEYPSRYSDAELAEFKEILDRKIEEAKKDLHLLRDSLQQPEPLETVPVQDGSERLSTEEVKQLLGRQEKFIQHLEAAQLRIKHKTYGICRVTGKLISKQRLRLVPHATLYIGAKPRTFKEMAEAVQLGSMPENAGAGVSGSKSKKKVTPRKVTRSKWTERVQNAEAARKAQDDVDRWWTCVLSALKEGWLGQPTIMLLNNGDLVFRFRHVWGDYTRHYKNFRKWKGEPIGFYRMERLLKESDAFVKNTYVPTSEGKFMMMRFKPHASIPAEIFDRVRHAYTTKERINSVTKAVDDLVAKKASPKKVAAKYQPLTTGEVDAFKRYVPEPPMTIKGDRWDWPFPSNKDLPKEPAWTFPKVKGFECEVRTMKHRGYYIMGYSFSIATSNEHDVREGGHGVYIPMHRMNGEFQSEQEAVLFFMEFMVEKTDQFIFDHANLDKKYQLSRWRRDLVKMRDEQHERMVAAGWKPREQHTLITPTTEAVRDLPEDRLQVSIEAVYVEIAECISTHRKLLASHDKLAKEQKNQKKRVQLLRDAEEFKGMAQDEFNEFAAIASDQDRQALVDMLASKIGWWPSWCTPTKHQHAGDEITQMNRRHFDQMHNGTFDGTIPEEEAPIQQKDATIDSVNSLLEMVDKENAPVIPELKEAQPPKPVTIQELVKPFGKDKVERFVVGKRFKSMHRKLMSWPADQRKSFLKWMELNLQS